MAIMSGEQEPDMGHWFCAVCGGDATEYYPARNRQAVTPVLCGHPNWEGLWWAPSYGRMSDLTPLQQDNQRRWKQRVKQWRWEQTVVAP